VISLVRTILFIGAIIGVIAIVGMLTFLDTNGASRLQSISSSAQSQNNLVNQGDNDVIASTPSKAESSPGFLDNNTNVIPKEAYDPYPYP
jgi:hypothetical protein